MVTKKEAYAEAVLELAGCGIENPRFDAALLFETVFGFRPYDTAAEAECREKELAELRSMVNRRRCHEPLQYIIGRWEFMSLDFIVEPGVLIPRPETELLVEAAEEVIKAEKAETVFDLCCGSGCVGISLAARNPVNVFMFDISLQALNISRINAENNDVTDSVEIIECDCLKGWELTEPAKADLIVSNPPYIKTSDLEMLQPELKFEPGLALDGGDDGLKFYRRLPEAWSSRLRDGGIFMLECGKGQAESIIGIFTALSYRHEKTIKDYAGIDRVLSFRKLP